MTIWFILVKLFLGVVGGQNLTEPREFHVAAQNLVQENGYTFWQKDVFVDKQDQQLKFLYDPNITLEKWDTLAQPLFWQNVMAMSPDTVLINIAACRTQLERVPFEQWMRLSESQKNAYKRQVCERYNLDTRTELYVTSGRSHFYDIQRVLPDIPVAMDVFMENGVDPWYAQSILLIESPGRHTASSNVGARGPFQLMRSVAREHGLTVNNRLDERTDLKKSAAAAADLIQRVCIPKAKSIMAPYNIDYNETDIWFRLMVLHVYHAGAGNVIGAVKKVNPDKGGIELIDKLWQTNYRGFQNQSQNYSQLALAANLRLYSILEGENEVLVLN